MAKTATGSTKAPAKKVQAEARRAERIHGERIERAERKVQRYEDKLAKAQAKVTRYTGKLGEWRKRRAELSGRKLKKAA